MSYSPPDAATFISRIASGRCCAAITGPEQIEPALASASPVVFLLRGNGLTLAPLVRRMHDAGKLVAVHIDLVSGLHGDRSSVAWLASAGVDAVISSHGQLMAPIRHDGMTAIQRLLLVRRGQFDTALTAIGRSAPQIVEILPGVILPSLARFLPDFGVPILAGGFIRTAEEAHAALAAGAIGVTTSTRTLWTNGAD